MIQHTGYACLVSSKLVACPFCRELFTHAEGHETCPECGGGDEVRLIPLEKLPPLPEPEDEIDEREAAGAPIIADGPLDQMLPWGYLGRSRGALVILGLLGIAAFFTPWVEMTMPELQTLSGYDLARGRLPHLWGGLAAWFTLVPLVLTRRTLNKMRGVRVICVLFAAMTLSEIVMLTLLPPSSGRVPVAFEWSWGMYVSAALSLVAMVFGARLGGSATDLRDVPLRSTERPSAAGGDTTLH